MVTAAPGHQLVVSALRWAPVVLNGPGLPTLKASSSALLSGCLVMAPLGAVKTVRGRRLATADAG